MDAQQAYEAVIGLELHAELLTASKMFCGCPVVDSVTAPPNTAVCPVCLGMPGMLPVINEQAVTFALRVALALHCQIQPHNVFARKSYFYPDLPKGYQISQYELPLARHGWLEIELDSGARRRIGIRRVHMEEDTAKLTHSEDGASSLVDYNRSGVPLLEIVTEPDIHSAEEAAACAMHLRQILRYLRVNSGDLEKGVLRAEPNISLRRHGATTFGIRTELKNINSFRNLAQAIEFEVARQAEILAGGGVVRQETRGWNESERVTFTQRVKEDADDYRYFPEPDLPALWIDEAWLAQVQATLPELPDAKKQRLQQVGGLSAYAAGRLVEERSVADWYEAAVAAGGDPKAMANWVLNNLFRLMNEAGRTIEEIPITPADLAALQALIDQRTISHSTAKSILAEMFTSGAAPEAIVTQQGLAQVSDTTAIQAAVLAAVEAHPTQLAQYLAGKEKLQAFFVGQVMRTLGGKGDPGLVNELVTAELNHRRG